MLILRVGDPHAKVTNLAELAKLMNFVWKVAKEKNVKRIELLGDLFHTHAILRLEVLTFWNLWLSTLPKEFEVYVLVGNHDQTGDYGTAIHAMTVFKNGHPNLVIVDEPIQNGPFAYMPYTHDSKEFIAEANSLADKGAKILVCHQTFSGSKYENGFFAPDGTNPDELRFDTIISGHIHSRQRFGKVIYPGTARWDSTSDANQPKGLWLVNHDDSTGAITSEEFIETDQICTPIFSLEWKEGDGMPAILGFPGNAKISLELIGSSNWISEKKAELKGKFSIKTKITDKSKPINRKAGLGLSDFVSTNFDTHLDRTALLAMMKELQIG